MKLASRCGIDVAETTLVSVGGDGRAILVKRFDRGPGPHFYPTAHYLSACSILDIDDTSSDGSYPQIAGALRQHAEAHSAGFLNDSGIPRDRFEDSCHAATFEVCDNWPDAKRCKFPSANRE